MASGQDRAARVPPRWVVRTVWALHRGIYSLSRGRLGASVAKPGHFGVLRLRTTGRRSGIERGVMLAYLADGGNFAVIAMNGWADPDPAWWLNLQAHPGASVDLPPKSIQVTGRPARDDERSRLWPELAARIPSLEAYTALRSRETALVILEPVQPQ